MEKYYLGDLIYILSKDIKKSMDRYLKEKKIGFGQFQTLMVIKRLSMDGEVTQELISREMDIDKSNVSRNINKLKETGYIRVEADIKDSRKNLVVLTEFANSQIESLVGILKEVSKQMTAQIAEEQLEITLDCLKKVIKNLNGE